MDFFFFIALKILIKSCAVLWQITGQLYWLLKDVFHRQINLCHQLCTRTSVHKYYKVSSDWNHINGNCFSEQKLKLFRPSFVSYFLNLIEIIFRQKYSNEPYGMMYGRDFSAKLTRISNVAYKIMSIYIFSIEQQL